MSVKLEQFASMAYLNVLESALNTLTFKKLEIVAGINLGQAKLGMLIHRIFYAFDPGNYALFNATGDYLNWGLSVTDTVSAPSIAYSEIIDYNTLSRVDVGVAASGRHELAQFEKDFNMLPGGGLLLPADRLYAWIKGTGLTAATYVAMRILYTVVELSADQYWQLVEQRHMLSI
jgi:hypothetical protein